MVPVAALVPVAELEAIVSAAVADSVEESVA